MREENSCHRAASSWRDRLRNARIEHARLQTELESLGREVDPHFLFNNLNALAHLIEHRSEAAPWFIGTLSATYQYVLDCRGRTLVPLAEELEALERHRALADTLRWRRPPRRAGAERGRPPAAPACSAAGDLQHALKHNSVASDRPLHIHVRVEDETLVVENNLRPGPTEAGSTGIGLTNLRERFRLATNRVMVWGVENDRFVVRLPLVSSADHAKRKPFAG
jgi:two-component system LytT family sensor kinase